MQRKWSLIVMRFYFCFYLRLTCLKCPVDGEKIAREESFRDKCCERELLDLRCSCRYKDRNCEWKGEFRNLKVNNLGEIHSGSFMVY